MADEPENLTIRLLQELRAEMREMRSDMTTRIDGNTIILNLLAGLLRNHEERIEALETGAKP